MNKFKVLGLVLLIVLLALVGSVYAQDATDEPTPVPTVEPTAEDVTAAPTVEATIEVTPLPLNEADRVSFSWTVASQVMLAVIVAFMAGGLTVGGVILLVLRTVLNNKTLSDMVEKLYLSQPIDKQAQQRALVKGVREVAEGLDTLTDGVLNAQPPADGTAVG